MEFGWWGVVGIAADSTNSPTLRELNHTPGFWSIVERLMPGCQTHKTTVAAIGKHIWFGEDR